MLRVEFEIFEEFIQWYNRKLQMALKFEKLDHQNMLFRASYQTQ